MLVIFWIVFLTENLEFFLKSQEYFYGNGIENLKNRMNI